MSDTTAAVIDATESVSTDTPVVEATESVGESQATDFSEDASVESDVVAPTTYKVKVGDAEQDVTLEDLQSGFMRQADYTRKTQEIAAQRSRLQQAEAIANSLDADPQGTLRALAEAFGVQAEGSEGFDPEGVDPNEARLQAIERKFQTQAQTQVRAEIDTEIDTLLNTYGDFDLGATIAHAQKHGMTVTSAYRDLNFDSAASKTAQTEQRTASKREAGVVEGGAHRTGVVPQANKPANSIREAWRQAQKSLGVSA